MNNEKLLSDLLQRYQYKYKDLTRRDIASALSYFKELAPRPDKYVYPNGTSRELISLLGTIPVNYRNTVYNIPVQLYFPDGFPYEPPMVYVRPTPDMNVNVSSTVDSSGRVHFPELTTEWRHPKSDLYMLLNLLTIRFSEETPLYTKSKTAAAKSYGSNQQPPYPVQPTPYPLVAGGGMPMPGSTASAYSNPSQSSTQPLVPNPYYPINSQPAQPLSHLKSNSNSNIGQTRPYYSDDTIKPEHYRISLITAVHDRIRAKYKEMSEEKAAEVDSLKRVHADLQSSTQQLNGLLNDAENESSSIRELTAELRKKTQHIGEAINRIKYRDKANIEDAVITTTPLYRQIFLLFAEDMSIQDMIFYLGEGLAHKTITLDSFLKQIRALTRKQFILRATIQRAREKAGLPV